MPIWFKYSPYQVVNLTSHNVGDGGTRVINLAVRNALRLPQDKIVKGDMLLVVRNNYKAERSDGKGTEIIRNGERGSVVKTGPGFIDVQFPKNSQGEKRCIRFLPPPSRLLPSGLEFGYAFSIHKAQGTQFSNVIAVAEPGSKAGEIVQVSSIYTCCSRARDNLIVLGNLDDFAKAAHTPDIKRETLLIHLLTKRDAKYSAKPSPISRPATIEIGARIATETFGEGTISAVETGKLGKVAQIKFDNGQVKKMLASVLKSPLMEVTTNG